MVTELWLMSNMSESYG